MFSRVGSENALEGVWIILMKEENLFILLVNTDNKFIIIIIMFSKKYFNALKNKVLNFEGFF